MSKKTQQIIMEIITELEHCKKEWLEREEGIYSWAVPHKAHAQGVASGISDAIYIIKEHMERNNING
jgi:hypothetical protein